MHKSAHTVNKSYLILRKVLTIDRGIKSYYKWKTLKHKFKII